MTKNTSPPVIPSDADPSRPYFFPPEGGADEQRLIAALAPIIARLCAVPAPEPQPLPAKGRKRSRGE